MPRFPKARPRRNDRGPAFLTTAQSFYGDAFGARRRKDLADAIADWAELSDEEQSFALAHLQYLNLVAQAGTQRLLARVGGLLEELVEGVNDALDEVPPPTIVGEGFEGEDDEDEEDDDGFGDDDVDFDEVELPEVDLPALDEDPGEVPDDDGPAEDADQADDEPEPDAGEGGA